MFGNINPKQIEGMMKKMGIAQTAIDAKRVIIELEDENIVIDEPSVSQIKMQGNTTWQISGEAKTEEKEGFSEDDVKMVMEKTGRKKEEVTKFLKENDGDMALAIIELAKK
jgi:nascent polypeptide-associated complex subunit alpha